MFCKTPNSSVNSRVVSVDGPSTGSSPLDGLHGSGVQGLLLGHGLLLITVTLGAFHLPLPVCLVHVVDPQQQAVVHDLEALQDLSTVNEHNRSNVQKFRKVIPNEIDWKHCLFRRQ